MEFNSSEEEEEGGGENFPDLHKCNESDSEEEDKMWLIEGQAFERADLGGGTATCRNLFQCHADKEAAEPRWLSLREVSSGRAGTAEGRKRKLG